MLLPVLVNDKKIDAKSKYLVYKAKAEEENNKKREIEQIDAVQAWKKRRAAYEAARSGSSGKKATPKAKAGKNPGRDDRRRENMVTRATL